MHEVNKFRMAHQLLMINNSQDRKKGVHNYTVVAVLDLSTPDPFPHPGFCLLAKFYKTQENINHQY